MRPQVAGDTTPIKPQSIQSSPITCATTQAMLAFTIMKDTSFQFTTIFFIILILAMTAA